MKNKMQKSAAIFFVTMTLFSCQNEENNKANINSKFTEKDDKRVYATKVLDSVIHNDYKKQLSDSLQKYDFVYKPKDNKIKKYIYVDFVNKNEIKFKFVYEGAKQKECFIEGTAKSLADVDPEIDEDETGEAYPSVSYVYENGGCYFSVRIAMLNRKLAQISSNNCKNICSDTLIFDEIFYKNTIKLQK